MLPPRDKSFLGVLMENGGSGFEPRFPLVAFSGSSHTSDFKIGTPVAVLPGAWHHRVDAGTGWPDVSILRRDERVVLICNVHFSVAARTLV